LINVDEVKTPETDAQLVAENIAGRIEKRASYKRAMKRALSDALRRGALGVKIMVSGRLAGAGNCSSTDKVRHYWDKGLDLQR